MGAQVVSKNSNVELRLPPPVSAWSSALPAYGALLNSFLTLLFSRVAGVAGVQANRGADLRATPANLDGVAGVAELLSGLFLATPATPAIFEVLQPRPASVLA